MRETSLFLVLLLLPFTAVDSFYVSSTEGNDNLSCGLGPTTSACKTIKYTIENIVPSNTTDYQEVLLTPGVYTGPQNRNISFANKRISLKSLGSAEDTVIDCEYLGRGFVVLNQNGTVEGITLRRALSSAAYPGKPGAGFHVGSSTFILKDSIVEYSDAPSDVSAPGGAMYIVNCDPVIINTVFQHNRAGVAGAIYMGTAAKPTFTDCVFYNNSAYPGGWGGALVPEEASGGVFINCTFDSNQATFGGAIDDGGVSTSSYHNCRFLRNFALFGGAYYGFANSNTTFYNCYFGYNIAQNTGGAARTTSEVTPIFQDCVFEYNTAKSAAGLGLYGESITTLRNCSFKNHIGQNGNGGIIAAVGGILHAENCTFYNASGVEGGGAINCLNSLITVRDCVFESCSAHGGGAIEFAETEYALIENCKFLRNYAENGGAISVIGSSSVQLIGNYYEGNKAVYGTIFMDDSGTANFSSSRVVGSRTEYGGVAYLARTSTLHYSFSSFVGNSAEQYGGALYVSDQATANLNNVDFIGNSAKYGSAIYLTDSVECDQINFSNLALINNSASVAGAFKFEAPYENCTEFCTNCVYEGNTALYGADYTTSFYQFALTSDIPKQVYAGQLFTIEFNVQDFFRNVMKGDLQIQLFANTSSRIKIRGVNTQKVTNQGTAVFESIALTGKPGVYFISFFSLPETNTSTFPIEITECEVGYQGHSETEDDYICLFVDLVSDSAKISIAVITGFLIVATLTLMALLWWKREDPVIIRAQVTFCELVALGALFCYVSYETSRRFHFSNELCRVYMWLTTKSSMCVLRSWLLGIGVSTILTSLILKEYKIYSLFLALDKLQAQVVQDKRLIFGTGIGVGIEILLLIIWTAVDPAKEYIDINLDTKELVYICYSDNSEIFLWILLGYSIVEMLVGVAIAYLSRDIPESYNESKYISFSIYNFVIALVVIMPLLYVLKKQTFSFLVATIGILFFTTVTMMMLFVPKIYYSINKKAVIQRLDKELEKKEHEISILKRQRRQEIKARSLEKEFEMSETQTQKTIDSNTLSGQE